MVMAVKPREFQIKHTMNTEDCLAPMNMQLDAPGPDVETCGMPESTLARQRLREDQCKTNFQLLKALHDELRKVHLKTY